MQVSGFLHLVCFFLLSCFILSSNILALFLTLMGWSIWSINSMALSLSKLFLYPMLMSQPWPVINDIVSLFFKSLFQLLPFLAGTVGASWYPFAQWAAHRSNNARLIWIHFSEGQSQEHSICHQFFHINWTWWYHWEFTWIPEEHATAYHATTKTSIWVRAGFRSRWWIWELWFIRLRHI